jgi:hypothetical protein
MENYLKFYSVFIPTMALPLSGPTIIKESNKLGILVTKIPSLQQNLKLN